MKNNCVSMKNVLKNDKTRKEGLNSNKQGSVRNVNGKVYVDFMYLDERVRESSGLVWNQQKSPSCT